jgi:hypothetical protein
MSLIVALRLAIKEQGGPDRIAVIRMSIIQEMLYRGLASPSQISVVKDKTDEIAFPTMRLTAGGIPVISDTSVPDDTIILEDRDGHELHRITGLVVPQPYSSEQE